MGKASTFRGAIAGGKPLFLVWLQVKDYQQRSLRHELRDTASGRQHPIDIASCSRHQVVAPVSTSTFLMVIERICSAIIAPSSQRI
ncbi:hypothetical protein QUB60_22350 [Microcoleus sp. A2-C5]|uniref:hypothetical protein n=1 Tax=unclassified Microcoleus TaxID=2642155 RepID=UPI002FCEC4E4